ncbi:MAG: hypothetical protein WD770_05710 [Actinomycetota bacterium]
MRRPIHSTPAALPLLLALAASACGGGGGTPATTPPTIVPVETFFGQGSAHVVLSGGVDVTVDLGLTPNVSGFDPNAASLSYGDSAGASFAVGGRFEDGPTSADLVVTINIVQPVVAILVSAAGECTLAFDDLSEQAVSGSFTCADLSSGGSGASVDAEGTFEAS